MSARIKNTLTKGEVVQINSFAKKAKLNKTEGKNTDTIEWCIKPKNRYQLAEKENAFSPKRILIVKIS